MQIFFFFFHNFFLMWTTFIKVFTEFITILLLFHVLFFGRGILTLQPGMVPAPSALESKVLTTGLPRKSSSILKD